MTYWVEGYEIVADLAETVPATHLVYVAGSGRRPAGADRWRRPARASARRSEGDRMAAVDPSDGYPSPKTLWEGM